MLAFLLFLWRLAADDLLDFVEERKADHSSNHPGLEHPVIVEVQAIGELVQPGGVSEGVGQRSGFGGHGDLGRGRIQTKAKMDTTSTFTWPGQTRKRNIRRPQEDCALLLGAASGQATWSKMDVS